MIWGPYLQIFSHYSVFSPSLPLLNILVNHHLALLGKDTNSTDLLVESGDDISGTSKERCSGVSDGGTSRGVACSEGLSVELYVVEHELPVSLFYF